VPIEAIPAEFIWIMGFVFGVLVVTAYNEKSLANSELQLNELDVPESPSPPANITTTPHAGKPSMARTAGLVAALTVVSKVIGLARDMMVASQFGTSIVADAYNYAYMFTGNILILFGGLGGPFHSSVVTVLTPRKDDPQTGRLILQMAGITSALLAFATVVMVLLAPFIVSQMSDRYSPDWAKPGATVTERTQATIATVLGDKEAANLKVGDQVPEQVPNLARSLFSDQMLEQLYLMIPLIIISGLVGISYGVLNVHHKMFWPSLSPAIASIAIIIAIVVTDDTDRLRYGIPLAVGTLAGAVGQVLAQLPSLFKLPLSWRLTTKTDPALHEYIHMLWPAMISTGVGQITVYIDGYFALPEFTGDAGAWTAVINSNRLVQLPLGILLTAMLVPILPRFTEHVVANRKDELKEDMRRALRFLWFLALPMTAILLAIPDQVVKLLFQRGNFTAESTQMVTVALVFLVPSMFFYVARDLITRVFYAFKDSKTPYYVALMAIALKVFLDWLLVVVFHLGIAGISLATTFITIFNLTMLTWFLKRKVGNLGGTSLVSPLLVMIGGSVVCGLIALSLHNLITSNISIAGKWMNIAASTWVNMFGIACGGAAGMAAYVFWCTMFKLEEPLAVGKRLPVIRNYLPK
jgi:putative peptidoglycan lipid II flippase